MTETAENLKVELAHFSAQERAELAYFLIHSLDNEIDDDMELAWDVELTRRLEEINQGVAGEPASQVFARSSEKIIGRRQKIQS